MKDDYSLINQSRIHDSGAKHVSGFAEYTDDISEPLNTHYGAIGWSKKAHAQIKKIDLKSVVNSEGVISVVTLWIFQVEMMLVQFLMVINFSKKQSRVLWSTTFCSGSNFNSSS